MSATTDCTRANQDGTDTTGDETAAATTTTSPAPYWAGRSNIRPAPDEYQQTLCQIENGHVSNATLLQGNRAVITYTDGTLHEIRYPSSEGAAFVQQLADHNIQVGTVDNRQTTTSPSNGDGLALSSAIWIVVILIVGVFLYQRWRNNQAAAFTDTDTGSGRSGRAENTSTAEAGGRNDQRNTRTQPVEIPTTRFTDVAGCDEAVDDLQELVNVLSNTERYEKLGARTPRGALLSGPPGTGKTLLARAVAGEAGVPFWACAGSDFVEKYVGVGARRVRDTFERARRHGRGIIFIDEIDAVGKRRGGDHANDERDNTLIALLNELDGFRESGLIVIAATNRADVLDDALLRPGRLDRRIHVGLPDVAGRRKILDIHTRSKPLDNVNLDEIARRCPGMSGAQLEQICNEAALEAARSEQDIIDHRCFNAAVELVAMGRARRSAVVTAADRNVTAWHEAGHTVAALCHAHADRPVSVSIIPRGEAGGVTWMEGADDHLLTRDKLRARLVVALAGRAAEELLMSGEHTAGASSDLTHATGLARAMVDRLGMTGRGLAVRNKENDDSNRMVDELLNQAHADAHNILKANRALLEEIVAALLLHDDLDSRALRNIAERHQIAASGNTRIEHHRRNTASSGSRDDAGATGGSLQHGPRRRQHSWQHIVHVCRETLLTWRERRRPRPQESTAADS